MFRARSQIASLPVVPATGTPNVSAARARTDAGWVALVRVRVRWLLVALPKPVPVLEGLHTGLSRARQPSTVAAAAAAADRSTSQVGLCVVL